MLVKSAEENQYALVHWITVIDPNAVEGYEYAIDASLIRSWLARLQVVMSLICSCIEPFSPTSLSQ